MIYLRKTTVASRPITGKRKIKTELSSRWNNPEKYFKPVLRPTAANPLVIPTIMPINPSLNLESKLFKNSMIEFDSGIF
jgi:hypothetical protein